MKTKHAYVDRCLSEAVDLNEIPPMRDQNTVEHCRIDED